MANVVTRRSSIPDRDVSRHRIIDRPSTWMNTIVFVDTEGRLVGQRLDPWGSRAVVAGVTVTEHDWRASPVALVVELDSVQQHCVGLRC